MMRMIRTVGSGTKSPKQLNKLARIVALATLMLGAGSVPSQAGSITHIFDQDTLVHDYNFGEYEFFGQTYYLYTFRVGFDSISTGFDLSITDNLVAFDGPDVSGVLGAGFKCAKITPVDGGECVDFVASSLGGLPQQDDQFAGKITIGIRYTPFGWPLAGPDPIDIGRTDNFSSFMLYASRDPDPLFPDADDTYRIVHFSGASVAALEPLAHCGGSDIDACARASGLPSFVVPEPASSIELLLIGIAALGVGVGFTRRS
jgi:hypothetical protein